MSGAAKRARRCTRSMRSLDFVRSEPASATLRPSSEALVDFVEFTAGDGWCRAGRGAGRGVRQRRHVVVREADADPARLHPAPPRRDGRGRARAARAPAVEGGLRARLRLAGRRDRRALRGRRPERADVGGGHPRGLRRDQRRGLRGAGRGVPAQRRSTRRSVAATSSARTRRWSSCSRYLEANGFTNYIASGGGRDFMRPISEEVYGIPRERVIGSSATLAYTERRARRHDHPQGRGRLSRRRPGEAGPHLEPHRPAPAARRRELERRHPDARASPITPTSRPCACSSSTTTPSASSTTRRAEQALRRARRGWTARQHQDDWATSSDGR